jgi:hypothetical protein
MELEALKAKSLHYQQRRAGSGHGAAPPSRGYTRPKPYAWADLPQRTFAIDVLALPDCGGRLRLLATIAPRYGFGPLGVVGG